MLGVNKGFVGYSMPWFVHVRYIIYNSVAEIFQHHSPPVVLG